MKKILSLVLALVLLCGCVPFAQAHEHDRWLPDYVYSGEIKLPEYMNTESYFPIVKEGEEITLTLGLVYDDTYTNPDKVKASWFYTWLSQFTGIKFDYMLIPKSALNERKALVFLEEKLPDILMGFKLTETELVTYGDVDQVLLDMTPYIHPDVAPSISLLMDTRPDAKGSVTTPSGKMYTLPQVYSDIDSNGYGKSELMFVRTEWLKEAGYETAPTTLDGFTEMLYKFKANHPDCIPLAASDGQQDVRSYILNAMGYLTDVENDTGYGPALRNGEVVIPAYTETFKEFLKVMNEYYVNGLIPQDYFTLDTTAEDAMLSEDNWGATNRASMSYISKEPAVFQQYWTGYPLTSQWNDKQQVAKYTNVNRIGGVAISADTEYPEVCVRLLDFWFTELGNIYQWEGPAYGSSDTLGMILGHSVTDEWVVTYHDVVEGRIESTGFYTRGETNPTVQQFGMRSYSLTRPDEITYYRMVSIELSGYEATPQKLLKDNADNWYKLAKMEGFFPYFVEGFPQYKYFDEETSLRLADLEAVIKPFIDSEVAKFITGINSIDQFDKFQEQLKAMGIEEYLKIYQDFYASYLANQ